ncbi:MAG: hypothetical protein U1F43_08410 [Myxococcota bacterium]
MRNPASIAASVLVLAHIGCGGDAGQTSNDTAADATSSDGSDATSSDGADATSADSGDDATTGDASDATTSDATDATTGDSADTGDSISIDTVDGGGPYLANDRYGARLWGAVLGLSRTGRTLWIGTRGNPDYMDPSETPRILGGLVRLDLDSGRVKVFADDELGLEDYAFAGYDGLVGPVATAGVHADGDRVIVVAHTGLMAIEDDTVTPVVVHMPNDGPAVVPVNLEIARDGLRPVAWLTSDQGLLRLGVDTLAVEAVYTPTAVGVPAGDFGKLTVDPDTGTVFATFFPTDASATRVVSVSVTGETHVLVPGTSGLPSGRVGDVVWSAADHRVYIALAAWNAAQGGVVGWDGKDPATSGSATTLVREGELANGNAFGAQILAIDDVHHVLAVGAQVLGNPIASPKGGGLAWVQLPSAAGDPVRVVSTLQKGIDTPFVTMHLQAMTFDPDTQRLYIAVSDICSETRLRSRGVFALSFDDKGALRFERPLMSSVRAMGLLDDHLWVGMRDDNGGLACLGYPITNGFAAVTDGGVADLNLMHPSNDLIVEDPAVTAMDGTSEKSFALGTFRDGFYVGGLATGIVGNPAFLGPSLLTTDVLWDDATSELWLAGGTTHGNGDTPFLADRGPRGAAVVSIGPDGPGAATRFVRASDTAGEVTGLPSGEIMDLLRGPDGSVLMACATETVKDSDWDRSVQPVFKLDGQPRKGGVATVSATHEVTVLAGPDLAPDARALAWDKPGSPDAKLLVADAERGLFRLDDGVATPIPTPGLPADAIPQVLWTSAAGDLALGTSKGLYLHWHGSTTVLDDVGFVWSVAAQADHLYVGSDAGLVVIREAESPMVTFPARPEGHAPPFAQD